jgi:hypothetical protein
MATDRTGDLLGKNSTGSNRLDDAAKKVSGLFVVQIRPTRIKQINLPPFLQFICQHPHPRGNRGTIYLFLSYVIEPDRRFEIGKLSPYS